MKKILLVLVALLMSVTLFADISGSVDSESTYDADAETLKEVVDTSVSIDALTINNKFTFANFLLDAEAEEEMAIAWAAEVKYAFNDAITAGFKAEFGDIVDEEGTAKLELNGSWTLTDFLALRVKYAIDNVNTPEGEDAETGSFTLGAKFSF